jgi:hypothetical protein
MPDEGINDPHAVAESAKIVVHQGVHSLVAHLNREHQEYPNNDDSYKLALRKRIIL